MNSFDTIRRELRFRQRRGASAFIVKFAVKPPRRFEDKVRSLVGADVSVTQLLKKNKRYWRVTIPGLSELATNDFDLAKALQDGLEAERVEPDLELDLFPIEPAVRTSQEQLALESFGIFDCWVGEDEPRPEQTLWALESMRVPQAWAISRAEGRSAEGDGIVIGQPDTGVAQHFELDEAIDERGSDLIDGDDDPTDPLRGGLFANPGHGTATASVVVSRPREEPGAIVIGSAPAARIAPYRCIESVVRVSQSRVAQAVEQAVLDGCHVITMSLGGIWSESLAEAIAFAVDKNVIVMAAAGNCWPSVVWPARFGDCIAVAGSNVHHRTWRGSASGSSVDISAPAQHVYRATHESLSLRGPDQSSEQRARELFLVGGGEGTSFATALTAGVAALWLAHHGRNNLIKLIKGHDGVRLQHVFRSMLKRHATKPDDWDHANFGAGIVNAEALLAADIEMPSAQQAPTAKEGRVALQSASPLPDVAREFLVEQLPKQTSEKLDDQLLDAHGLELMVLAATAGISGRETTVNNRNASEGLCAALARDGNEALAACLHLDLGYQGEALDAGAEEIEGLLVDPHVDPQDDQARAYRDNSERPSPNLPWRLAAALETLRAQIDDIAADRDRTHDGTFAGGTTSGQISDHQPWIIDGDTAVVSAVDITHDPANGCDAHEIARALWTYQDSRIQHVIWNGQIMSSAVSPWNWRPYSGADPHHDKIHVSVRPESHHHSDSREWQLATPKDDSLSPTL